MPTVAHVKVYEKKLVTDTYQISKACCSEFKMSSSNWKFCPYCGEAITVDALQESIEEV